MSSTRWLAVFGFATALASFASAQWPYLQGTPGGNDRGLGIATDHHGNVIACGGSGASPASSVIVRKFTRDGALIWSQSRDGFVDDVAIDAQDNVIVVGGVARGDSMDCLLIKYDRHGNLLWEQRLPGIDQRPAYGEVVRVDSAGNILVGGRMGKGVHAVGMVALYDADGHSQWTRKFEASLAGNIDVRFSPLGGVVTLGNSRDSTVATLQRIDGTGVDVWTRKYRGSGGAGAVGVSIDLDAAGNLVMAATNQNLTPSLVKYDPNGARLWTRQLELAGGGIATGVTVGPAGEVYLATMSDYRYTFARYAADGNRAWRFVQPIAGIRGFCNLNRPMLDAKGNLLAIGSVGDPGGCQVVAIKISPDGVRRYWKTYRRSGTSYDWAMAAGIDPVRGDSFVAGTSVPMTGDDGDFLVTRF